MSPRIRVLWVCTPLLPVGGGFQHLRLWARHLDHERYEVTLLHSSPDPGAVERVLGEEAPLRILARDELRSIRAAYVPALRAIRGVVAATQPDLVHSVFIQSDILASGATAIGRRPRRISSAFGYLTQARGAKRALYRTAYRLALAKIDVVTAISEVTARELRDDFGAPAAKLRLLRSGIDVAQVAAGRDDVGRDMEHVVVAAQLIREKGIDVFLDAFAEVAARHPRAHASIAGEGPEREALVSRAASLGIADRVRFVGHVSDVPGLLGRAGILVAAARPGFDGVPRIVLEAMASGAVVISTTVGGIAEIVRDGQDGVLIGPPDAGRIASALGRLLAEPAAAARMRGSAAARIAEFDVRREVATLSALYDDLAERAA